jgi:hypothetical protein
MNSFVASRFVERVQRLALGVEPIDAASRQPMLTPVMLVHDDAHLGHRRQPFLRHASNRQALLYDAYYSPQPHVLKLRLFDQAQAPYGADSDRRRFVPRRLQITLPSLASAEAPPMRPRSCRPHLFPGPAYPVADAVTGLRAHVMHAPGGPPPLRPVRWARVLATVPATQANLARSTVVGRAFCDERGEFLLLIRAHADAIGPGSTLAVRLRVFAAPTPPPNPVLAALDPLWDLPIELPASLADDDPVLRGENMPPGYVAVTSRVIDLPLGRLLRGQPSLLI